MIITKKLHILFWLTMSGLFLSLDIFAQVPPMSRENQPQYAASNIPDSLQEGAYAVMRENTNRLFVRNIGKASFNVSYVLTVLNQKGDRFADLSIPYDKLTRINYIQAAVYDAEGNFVKILKKREIKDYSTADGYSLYTDNRVKSARLSHNTYPYTIKCKYSLTLDGLLFYPNWYPQTHRKIAVEHSSFSILTPKDISFRYKEINLEKAIKSGKAGGSQTWKIANLPVFQSTAYSKENTVPRLLLAPNTFEIERYKGNMQSWKSFGQWISTLNAKRDSIAPATIKKIKQLTARAKTNREKIKIVYHYLQQNTRYVSIQLGIGSWQPFKAITVDQKGYGDCKALSNFTHSLLKHVGIESHYTLVRAGRNEYPIQTDFPSTQFNHVILCVPNAQDTVWLECTSQRESFNYLSSFTSDRDVLLITPEGGKIVHTPVYNQTVNTLQRTAEVKVDAEGNALATVNTAYKAIQSNIVARLVNKSPENQKKWLYNNLDIASFEIQKHSYNLERSNLPVGTENLQLKIRKLASKSGKRLFLKPNFMNRYPRVPYLSKDRKSDIYISSARSFTDIDSIHYQIPEKYHAEYKPAPVRFSNAFGSYEMQVTMDAGKITYIRKMVVNAGTFPKEKYQDMIKFYKKVVKADKEMVVLISGT